VVEAYKLVVHFKVGCHYMYVQAKKDPNQEWLPTQNRLTKEEIGHIMEDWDVDWKILPIETKSEKLET
jgi:hypothetical protein